MVDNQSFEAEMAVGPRAIGAYARLSYTMWYALAEFIDNSTQSRRNYGGVINEVLDGEGTPLVVEITHDRMAKQIRIRDNSIGMSRDDLVNALRIANPTPDSKGRSRYGMGLKTAACWIGASWKVVTAEWSSGEEWTATVDVEAVADGERIPMRGRSVDTAEHYTEITISGLRRNIQKRTEENIREYLGSMYRFDLLDGSLKLIYNGEDIQPQDDGNFDTDAEGKPYKRTLPPVEINGHAVSGWIGVLRQGAGGRKYAGFSLFQNKRQIEGFPKAWKPTSIFGGVDNEGANNLIAQRLTGVLELDGFEVSHTKDAILFQGSEQEELEAFLAAQSKDYREYAARRRRDKGQPWSREKVKDLIENMRQEFQTDELKDAADDLLPPLQTILENNQRQVASLAPDDEVATWQVMDDLVVRVFVCDKSEYEPYLTIVAAADNGCIQVVINNLHPYYADIEAPDAKDECIRQYIYDAISEYQVSRQAGRLNPNSVRRKKDGLLRARSLHAANVAAGSRDEALEAVTQSAGGPAE